MIARLRALVEGRKGRPTRGAVLGSRPQRHPAVLFAREGEDNLVLLRVPRRSDRLGNLLARWFRLPEYKKIELDEIGSDVWELCDGTHSVREIAGQVAEKYRLNRRQTETTVTAYLKMLAERRLVGVRTTGGSASRKTKKA